MSPLNNVIEHGIAEEREEDFEQDEDGIIVERREPEVKGELTSVNLRSNQLKGTIILGNYGNLTTLDVSENSIESLDLGALNRLESIKCSRNQLKTLVLNGSSLISVIAGNNKLQSLIVSPRPARLQHLDISYNELESLPDWIDTCPELETIFASHNRITQLPSQFFCRELGKLHTLQLSFNRLTSLPSLIRQIASLKYLFLQSNSINILPQLFLQNSSKLKVLNISKNCLKMLPSLLNISQLRLPGFCNSDALIGIFDSGDNGDIASTLVQSIPRILLEERTVKETASDYMKYTMLTAHREIKDSLHRYSLSATLCHLSLHPVTHRYMLHIASVGEAKAILCRQAGSLTFTHAPTLSPPVPPQGSCPLSFPDPHVTEVMLHENDHFLILANKSVWDVLSGEEAVAEVRSVSEPVLAAKRIQDLAQSYGSEDNLSVLVLRFQGSEFDSRTRDAKLSSMRKLGVQDPECPWTIEYDRSSPSGQSDQASSGHTAVMTDTIYNKMDKYNFGDRRSSLGYRSKSSGKSIVDTMSASERSAATHLSE
ncbi:protein phosphatase PHLPP-like protein [Diaphorina citri]|uniref:Protein phosphatase PHLPP-like protein n=1 Tax=Diaphorina citri TaxID=121845 RepID=A0A3Q0J4R6_DIACI|nr:protein phosphatase PHLPP-like protein [Diaphorina citri]